MLLNIVLFRPPKNQTQYDAMREHGVQLQKVVIEVMGIKLFCKCSITKKITKNWQETNASLEKRKEVKEICLIEKLFLKERKSKESYY